MTSPTSKENNRVMGKIVNSTFVSLDGVINHMDRVHCGNCKTAIPCSTSSGSTPVSSC